MRLYGLIDDNAVRNFLQDIDKVRGSDAPLVMELTTEGGDAEGGRRIALEVRLLREQFGKETFFMGKTVVMSAGATVMAAFPRDHRFLTRDTVLLIHERRMQKSLDLNGPLRGNIQIVREMLAQLQPPNGSNDGASVNWPRTARSVRTNFTSVPIENCYLTAEEALELELVAGLI